ncbi:MAG: hypothetical protein HS111_16985 [Kofleriaceae bacterium]|nr:hypothetical protein [Kofleriaceae bacterium]
MSAREHADELTPELVEHLERSSDGLPIEALAPLSGAELVELLMARTRLGPLVRDEITSWLAGEDAARRADDLRAYIAAGQDARDALTVHRHASRSLPAEMLS